MKLPLVTVIIPVHKTIPYLRECINSVLNQEHTALEIIVACNGSLEIDHCQHFINSTDTRLRFIKTAPGRYNARNEALEAANGAFIQYLDYDDYLFPAKISTQLKAMTATKTAICICKWKKFSKSIEEYYRFPYDALFLPAASTALDVINRLGKKNAFIATSAYLFTSDIAQKATWIDSPNDDAVYFSALCSYNPSVLFVQDVLAGYRMHADNNSTITTVAQFELVLRGWSQIEHNLKIHRHKDKHAYLLNAYLHVLPVSVALQKYRLFYVLRKISAHVKSLSACKVALKALLKNL